MLSTVDPAEIPRLLRKVLGPRWDFTIDGDRLEICHQDHATPYCPPRQALPWPDLLALLEAAFADQGVPCAVCLPLRCGRETELTISAVQALDPVLKDGGTIPYRQGFIPQPVVRLTAERAADGSLQDGFLTSFVNTSRVELIPDLDAYAAAFDQLLSVLSRLSLHARHITFHGRLHYLATPPSRRDYPPLRPHAAPPSATSSSSGTPPTPTASHSTWALPSNASPGPGHASPGTT